MEAKELVELLRQRYTSSPTGWAPSYAVLEQVPDGTGANQGRWIDIAVFSLWPSKGLTRSAFEIKVSTSDFRRELQNPMKYEWARKAFHEFWYLAPSGVIDVDELPKGVGLMVTRGKGLAIKKHCKRNESPVLDDALLAGFMRASTQEIEKRKRIGRKEVLDASPEYQRARLYEDAVNAFCLSRHEYTPYDERYEITQETIAERLTRATMDEELKKDLRHIDSVLGDFESKIVYLFSMFGFLANASITAKNEVGENIVRTYGNFAEDLQHLVKASHPAGKMMKDRETDYQKILGIIQSWGK